MRNHGVGEDASQGKVSREKLVTLEQMLQIAALHRKNGQTLVFTNGCFDLLHAGHRACLSEAAAHGDVLIVALNSDKSVRELKGPGRPVVDQEGRATRLAALECVDYVLVFEDRTPEELLRHLRPDVLVKGGDYRPQEIVGRNIVESYGGQVTVTGYVDGVSTTELLRGTLHERGGS